MTIENKKSFYEKSLNLSKAKKTLLEKNNFRKNFRVTQFTMRKIFFILFTIRIKIKKRIHYFKFIK